MACIAVSAIRAQTANCDCSLAEPTIGGCGLDDTGECTSTFVGCGPNAHTRYFSYTTPSNASAITISLTVLGYTDENGPFFPPDITQLVVAVINVSCFGTIFCNGSVPPPPVLTPTNFTNIPVSPNTTYIIAIGHVDGIITPVNPPQTAMSFSFCIQPLAYDTSSSQEEVPSMDLHESWGAAVLPGGEGIQIWTTVAQELELIDSYGRVLHSWRFHGGERRVERLTLPAGIYRVRERNGLRYKSLLWQ